MIMEQKFDMKSYQRKVISKNTAFSLTPNVDYSKVILLCANCHRELHYEENGRKEKQGVKNHKIL